MFPGLMPPQGMNPQGRTSGAQKQLMSLLATMVLNKRLRQGGMNQSAPPIGNPGMGPGNKMADLARMQLNMNNRGGRGEGLPPGLIGRPLPPGLARRTTLPPGLM